jgi:hypothetical protein
MQALQLIRCDHRVLLDFAKGFECTAGALDIGRIGGFDQHIRNPLRSRYPQTFDDQAAVVMRHAVFLKEHQRRVTLLERVL